MNPAKLARQLNEAATAHQGGDLDSAERLYRAVLKQVPKQPDALHLLGVLLNDRGDRAKGISFVRQALAVHNGSPDAHFNLARMLLAEGDWQGAKAHYDTALAFKPGHARSHNGLGILYRSRGDYAEAMAAFERAIRFDPRFLNAYINLCNTYRDSRSEAEILKVVNQGLAVDPANAQLHLLRAESEFTVGRLADGWRDYEWRFTTPQNPVARQNYSLPFWKGEDLASKSILIWCEQGVGDEIIFSSMVRGVAARAKRCVLQTTPRLVPLFARSFPTVEVFGSIVPEAVVGTLDLQIAMGSVGQWLRPSFGSFPVITSYLAADAGKTAALRAKYKATRERNLVVGVAWRSTNVTDAAEKTVDLAQWGAMLKVPGVTFVNLQYGDTQAALAEVRNAFGVEIIDDNGIDALADLDSYAAQVAAMDLVISSSNSAAHMAGALGVPVFCMVPRALGSGRRWYWFGEGNQTPWYRSMTLFRQHQTGWAGTVAEVAVTLLRAVMAAGAAEDSAATPALREVAKLKLQEGAVGEALALVEQALSHDPESTELHNMRGMILAREGRLSEAEGAYTRAIAYAPLQAEIYNNLGTVLRRLGRGLDASKNYARAYELKPDQPSIALNHAMALFEIDQGEAALTALDALIAAEPEYADAHYNRALVLLSLGKCAEGWKAFKWRLKRAEVHVRHEDFPAPVWAGADFKNKHVLAWTDLGLGEEILTASLIPDLSASAKRVTLLCSERLVDLFRRSFPGVTVEMRKSPLPTAALAKDIDAQMSLAELGAAFRPTFSSFPDRPAFLKADTNLRDQLRQKYLGSTVHRLVGLSWRSTHPSIGAQKSSALAQWLPLLKAPGITFVSLQYGDNRAEIEALRQQHGVNIIHDADIDMFGDMDPVAAQVAAMDHVVSISNTTAHLAGALGVPTWILLPKGFGRLWYWFRGLERCAWYPSARLMVSPDENDWDRLIARCADEMQHWAAARP